MGLAGFLRKLQDIYTKHKLISTIFVCLLVIPPSYFYSFYATGHLINYFLTDGEDSNNPIATTFHYISFVAQVEGFAVIGISMFFLLVPLLQILASNKIDLGAELNFKSLILIVTKPARSLIVTWLIVRLFKFGYIFVGILSVFHQRLMFVNYSGHEQSELCALPGTGTTIFIVGGVIFFAYLANVGNLALVISVHEGASGIEALEKASQLLEGKKKLIGFLLNLILGVVSVGLFFGYENLNTCSKLSVDSKKDFMWNIYDCTRVVEFYTWIPISILYFKCKNDRGEKIFQPQGSLKRIQVEELPLVSRAQME